MKILLTKSELQRARRRYKRRRSKFGLAKDTDRDGFPDFLDGHPRNPRKHSLVSAVASSAASSIVSEVLKEEKKCPIPVKRDSGFDKLNPFLQTEKALRRKR